MNLERHKLTFKRWLTTVNLPTVPVLPQFTPELPDSLIGRRWPVFGRAYPRSIRWPLNTSRTLVWLVARGLQPFTYIWFLRPFIRAGWNIGAALQALVAVVVASLAYTCVTVPLRLTGSAARGAAWVVLVRRGWQPPLPAPVDDYMAALDRELDAAVAAQDRADALTAAMHTDRPDYLGGPPAYVEYPLYTSDPALTSDSTSGRRGPRLRAFVLAGLVVAGLAVGVTSVDLPVAPEWSEIHEANQHNSDTQPIRQTAEVGP